MHFRELSEVSQRRFTLLFEPLIKEGLQVRAGGRDRGDHRANVVGCRVTTKTCAPEGTEQAFDCVLFLDRPLPPLGVGESPKDAFDVRPFEPVLGDGDLHDPGEEVLEVHLVPHTKSAPPA